MFLFWISRWACSQTWALQMFSKRKKIRVLVTDCCNCPTRTQLKNAWNSWRTKKFCPHRFACVLHDNATWLHFPLLNCFSFRWPKGSISPPWPRRKRRDRETLLLGLYWLHWKHTDWSMSVVSFILLCYVGGVIGVNDIIDFFFDSAPNESCKAQEYAEHCAKVFKTKLIVVCNSMDVDFLFRDALQQSVQKLIDRAFLENIERPIHRVLLTEVSGQAAIYIFSHYSMLHNSRTRASHVMPAFID